MSKEKQKDPRIRGSNFTKEEELNLVKIIHKHKNVIECKNTNILTPARKENSWLTVLHEFNSFNTKRTLPQIKSKYDNLKTQARKYGSSYNKEMFKTGGGQSDTPKQNATYDLLLDVLNKKTVIGFQNLNDDDGECGVAITESDTEPEANIFCVNPSESEKKIQSDMHDAISLIIESDMQKQSASELTKPSKESRAFEEKTEVPENWTNYTPKMLKQPRNRKLCVRNKAPPKVAEKKTLYMLKEELLNEKIKHLKNEELRKQELHLKQMECIELQIKQLTE